MHYFITLIANMQHSFCEFEKKVAWYAKKVVDFATKAVYSVSVAPDATSQKEVK